ncbi:SirA family protein [Oceanimonas baumannii]|nr:SirA family protein [Oceanimonas baumannii]
MEQLDASHLRCPQPLLEVKLWLKSATCGQQLCLVLADPGSQRDIPAYLKRIGHGVTVVTQTSHRLELIITKHS